jgi:hypothetical protein
MKVRRNVRWQEMDKGGIELSKLIRGSTRLLIEVRASRIELPDGIVRFLPSFLTG